MKQLFLLAADPTDGSAMLRWTDLFDVGAAGKRWQYGRWKAEPAVGWQLRMAMQMHHLWETDWPAQYSHCCQTCQQKGPTEEAILLANHFL